MPAFKLDKFLSRDRVVMDLAAGNQRDTLEQLIGPLIRSGVVTDADQFLEALIEREGQITTVMENSVAIPHARSHAVTRLGLVVGLTNENGIHFNPDDEQPSRLFFCIAIPFLAPSSHIPLLELLAKFSRNPARVEKLLTYKTAAGVVRNLGAFKG